MPRDLSDKKPIDMTLRLWSDEIPLEPILSPVNLAARYLHCSGEPISYQGSRIANRHFASIANTKGSDDSDLAAWLALIIDVIGAQPNLINQMLSGQIEALLWIAIFGRKPIEMPHIALQTVKSCSELGLKIMIENYTDFDINGVPKKLWLSS